MEHIREGAAQTGRSLDEMDIACYIIFSVDEEGDAARQATKVLVAYYLRKIPNTDHFLHAGLDVPPLQNLQNRLRQAHSEDRFSDAIGNLPEDVVQALAVAGTPGKCLEGFKAYADACVKTLISNEVLGPDRLAAVALTSERIRPALVERSSK